MLLQNANDLFLRQSGFLHPASQVDGKSYGSHGRNAMYLRQNMSNTAASPEWAIQRCTLNTSTANVRAVYLRDILRRRSLIRSFATSVPSWKDPNQRSHGNSAVP